MSTGRKLFTVPLTPISVILATAEGITSTTKLVCALHLVINNDSNKHHTYSINNCVYYPESPLNTLGFPAIGVYFEDGADIRSPLQEDITIILSGSTKSHFVWDHGKHERHFIHGSRQLPELILYFGYGYFNALCTRVHKILRYQVHYAFLSAYSIESKTVSMTPYNPHIVPFEK